MTDKSKNKPDYTKFMKKPAPLEPLTPPVPDPAPPVSEPAVEDEIPSAEILTTPKEADAHATRPDLPYFETVSEEQALPEISQAPVSTPTSDYTSQVPPDIEPAPDLEPSYMEEEPYYDTPKIAQDPVTPPQPRFAPYTDDSGILEMQLYAFQPPPVPALIAPILIALLFLAF